MIARKHKGETRDPAQLAEQRAAEAARAAANWTSDPAGPAAGENEEDPAAETPEPRAKRGRTKGVSEVQRFNVIIFFFINMGAPPEEEWDGAGGAVAFIRKKMDPQQDAARSVRGYMAKIWTMLTNSEDPMRIHGTKCCGRVDVGDDTELSIANLS